MSKNKDILDMTCGESLRGLVIAPNQFLPLEEIDNQPPGISRDAILLTAAHFRQAIYKEAHDVKTFSVILDKHGIGKRELQINVNSKTHDSRDVMEKSGFVGKFKRAAISYQEKLEAAAEKAKEPELSVG